VVAAAYDEYGGLIDTLSRYSFNSEECFVTLTHLSCQLRATPGPRIGSNRDRSHRAAIAHYNPRNRRLASLDSGDRLAKDR
jgi:hypothetical protein